VARRAAVGERVSLWAFASAVVGRLSKADSGEPGDRAVLTGGGGVAVRILGWRMAANAALPLWQGPGLRRPGLRFGVALLELE
jgi:hypothetical protein